MELSTIFIAVYIQNELFAPNDSVGTKIIMESGVFHKHFKIGRRRGQW